MTVPEASARTPWLCLLLACLLGCGGFASAFTPTPDRPEADGRCTVIRGTDSSTYTYASGRLIGATGTFGNMSTTFTYGDDRLVTVERRDPQRILFVLQIQYDGQGRPREVLTRQPSDSNPEAVVDFQRRAFTYGSDGRLERHATEGVSKTTFEYDAQGRMTEEVKHYERSEDPPSRTKYTYDPSGRLGSIGTEHQTWTYHYAPSGQRDRMTMTNSAGRVLYEQSMEYDASGRLVARRVTAGRGDAEKVEYEGTFGAGAVCGELHTVPQGIPAEYGWLGISP